MLQEKNITILVSDYLLETTQYHSKFYYSNSLLKKFTLSPTDLILKLSEIFQSFIAWIEFIEKSFLKNESVNAITGKI